MSSDEDWDAVKKSAEKLSLAQQFFKSLTIKQRHNLMSNIYKNTGTGQIPVSGGKIEGKKRGKM